MSLQFVRFTATCDDAADVERHRQCRWAIPESSMRSDS
jgi:hypothetical protein